MSTWQRRRRPSYSRMSVNVGLTTGPWTPSPRPTPWASAVLPVPSSPERTTTSPTRRTSRPSSSPRALVSSTERLTTFMGSAPGAPSARDRSERRAARPPVAGQETRKGPFDGRSRLPHGRPDRSGDGLGRRHPQPVGVGVDGAGGQHGGEIAVVTGVGGMDRPGETVVSRLGQQQAVGLPDPGVGGHHHQRGVLERRRGGEGRRAGWGAGGAGKDGAVGPEHIPERVAGHERPDGGVALGDGGGAEPGRHGVLAPPPLAGGGAAPGADRPRRRRPAAGGVDGGG